MYSAFLFISRIIKKIFIFLKVYLFFTKQILSKIKLRNILIINGNFDHYNNKATFKSCKALLSSYEHV